MTYILDDKRCRPSNVAETITKFNLEIMLLRENNLSLKQIIVHISEQISNNLTTESFKLLRPQLGTADHDYIALLPI